RLASWLVIVVSLAIDNRLRSGPVSFTVGELGALVFIAASLFRQPSAAWRIRRDHLSLLLIMATSAAIAWSRDPDAVHALSAVRDVFLPILLFLVICNEPPDRVPLTGIGVATVMVTSLAAMVAIAQFVFGVAFIPRSDIDTVWTPYKLESLQGYFVANLLGLKGVLAVGTY